MEELKMTNEIMNVKEPAKTEVQENTYVRYRTSDGLIFTSKEEYLDYIDGLRNWFYVFTKEEASQGLLLFFF